MMDWLGTPVWFWMSFIGIVIGLTAFDLGILHKEDKEMGIAESLKLSVFYIAIAMAFGIWVWIQKGGDMGMKYYTGYLLCDPAEISISRAFVGHHCRHHLARPDDCRWCRNCSGILLGAVYLCGVPDRNGCEDAVHR
jgi:hypothetical protein